MSDERLTLLSVACGAVSLACVFAVVALEQYVGLPARTSSLSWVLLAAAIALAIPTVAVYRRVGVPSLTGGRRGGGRFLLYLMGALSLAALGNALRLALFG